MAGSNKTIKSAFIKKQILHGEKKVEREGGKRKTEN